MMNKKIFFFAIIILLIPCYALAVVKVSDLYPAYKVYDAVNKIWTVPAKVVARSSTAIATDSVALGLTKSIAGGIVTGLAIYGAGYVGNELLNWLMDEPRSYYYENNILKKNVTQWVAPPGCDAAVRDKMIADCGAGSSKCHVVDTCYATVQTCTTPTEFVGRSVWVQENGFYFNGCQYPISIYMYSEGYYPNTQYYMYGKYWSSDSCRYQTTVPTPVTLPEVQNQVDTAIEGAEDESAPIVDVVNETIDKAADIVNDGEGIRAKSPSVAYTIENYLNSAIPADAANALNEKVNADNATDTMVDDAASSAATESGIFSAVTKALQNFFGADVTPPADLAITTPTKKNLTTILTSFYNSINSLPIMSTLNGIAVTASGTSQLCVNLPASYGGTRCWNAAGNQSDFNMIGSALLAVVSILSVMHIFRG